MRDFYYRNRIAIWGAGLACITVLIAAWLVASGQLEAIRAGHDFGLGR